MMSEPCLLCDKCFVKFQFYYGPFDCHKSLIRKLLQANGGTNISLVMAWIIVKT